MRWFRLAAEQGFANAQNNLGLPDDEVVADKRGNPVLERRSFLLDCQLEEDEVRQRYPKLWAYLEEGKAQGVPKRYLCRHRTPWYTQENRPPPPFLCTYLGRSDTRSGRPFRFMAGEEQGEPPRVREVLLFLAARGLRSRV